LEVNFVESVMNRWIMHIDMDAFYASVEQYRLHPDYIGKPLCVGFDPRKGKVRGVVRAASYEARAFGIKAGMPISKALQLCPNAVFSSGGFSNYTEASQEFMEVLREYADGNRVRRASIDEAYIEVTSRVQEYQGPRELALEIQQAVKERTQLPCSIGIAPNMSVAKVATGMNKPMGVTLVSSSPEEVMKFLAPLKVDALNGVGAKTAERLTRYGIETLGQIQQMTITELWPAMGRGSSWLKRRASGIDERPLIDNGPRLRKSIGHDRTYMEDVPPEKTQLLHHTLAKLSTSIAKKLVDKKLQFRTVTVKIRYADYTTVQRSKSIPVGSDSREQLFQLVLDVFDQKRNPNKAVRLLGVRVTNLMETKEQAVLTQFV
jgi:nucleotidyltransferase/DNA polymerase involved in DNA repair